MRACCFAKERAGSSMAARIAMIGMTTNSSIKVNAAVSCVASIRVGFVIFQICGSPAGQKQSISQLLPGFNKRTQSAIDGNNTHKHVYCVLLRRSVSFLRLEKSSSPLKVRNNIIGMPLVCSSSALGASTRLGVPKPGNVSGGTFLFTVPAARVEEQFDGANSRDDSALKVH